MMNMILAFQVADPGMRYNSIKYLADPDPTIVLPAGTLKVWFEVSDAVLFANWSPKFCNVPAPPFEMAEVFPTLLFPQIA